MDLTVTFLGGLRDTPFPDTDGRERGWTPGPGGLGPSGKDPREGRKEADQSGQTPRRDHPTIGEWSTAPTTGLNVLGSLLPGIPPGRDTGTGEPRTLDGVRAHLTITGT